MRYSVKPKKSFGQHFLKSPDTAHKIVQQIADVQCKNVLEVGPGMGILTQFLADKEDIDFRAIEVDREAVNFLLANYPKLSLKIIHADFLHYSLSNLFDGKKFVIIGNFPYNISSQILFKTIECREQVPLLVGMFQKEVAERVAAKPVGKSYGVLTIFVQLYYEVEYLFTLNEDEFSPPPKVKSAVIRLTRNTVKELPCNEKLFTAIVKQTFQQRRKMLRNTLKSFIDTNTCEHSCFDKRPETLSITDFIELTNFIEVNIGKKCITSTPE